MAAATRFHSIARAHRNVRYLWRWYRKVPEPLRRPEPAIRFVVVGACVWFGSLFAFLGLIAARRSAEESGSVLGWAVVSFVAAAAAPLCAGLVMTRRYRAGVWVFAAMLVAAQVCAAAVALQ